MTGHRGAFIILILVLTALGPAGPAHGAAPRQRMGIVAAGYPPKAGRAELNDVSCVDRSHCLAVGYARTGGKYRTLFERWTGSRWQVMPSPTPPNAYLQAKSISCSSTTACMAVGFYQRPPLSTRHFDALVERWNGTRWRRLPAPTFGMRGSHQFTAVSCPAARFCVAIGSNFADNDKQRPSYGVVASWNGRKWHEVHRDSRGRMEGVACVSRQTCTVIFAPGRGNHLHRLQLANGRWTAHVDNLVGVQSAINLTDLDCVAASSCTAVGFNFQLKEEDAAAAYHWNGDVWRTLHPGARKRLHSRDLNAVSCPTPTECVAVGTTDRTSAEFGAGQVIPLVERFHNGRTQVVSARPARHSSATILGAVACLSSGLCRGVGSHTRGDTQVEHPFADQGAVF